MSDTTNTKTNNHVDPWTDLNLDDAMLQNLLDKPLEEQDTTRLRNGEQHEGFDNNVGDSWIYPTNLPSRAYQLSIVQAALYRNTLVVLPTGLGKTFIAAVVMYNMYRWYPRGKVIFMAPTRPLVNQQIEACQKIMPFPRKDTIELTGKLQRAKRSELWKTKRVFFATPQVVQSDIFGGQVQEIGEEAAEPSFEGVLATKTDFPFDLVKLIVIDEAHKAKGKYAYSEVAHAIAQKNKYFRVLALSATPGRTMEDVAEVCRNLFISHLEVRWDTSIDVLPYVHKKSMQTIVVSLGEHIKEIREQLLQIVDPYLRHLTEADVLSGSLTNINRNFLLYEQKRFRDRSFHNGRHPQHSAISTNFAICISLYHALELLERHGLRVFLNNFDEDEEGKGKFVLQMDRRLRQLVDNLKQHLGPNPFEVSAGPMTNGQIAEIPKNLDFGHPKFEKARECLVQHFQNNEDTRAIVFCEYRESVMLIYRMLLQHVPLLKPRCFVGQGGTSGSLRALTQKQQIQIMNDFRCGKSNILIATSIGEEGIDVGEVDLIVCFDISTSNPTRFVQRIGRTGRKKNGHVVMLVTEGREEQLLKEVMTNKDQTNKKLLKSVAVQQALYKHAPRMVPTEFKPKCIQTFIKPSADDEDEETAKTRKSGPSKSLASKNKPIAKGVQDLRKFFQKTPKELDKEDLEYFEIDAKMTQAKPGLQTQQKMEKSFDKRKNLFTDLRSPLATQTQQTSTTKKAPEVATNSSNRKKLNNSQVSIKDFLTDLNDSLTNSCDEVKDQSGELLKSKTVDPDHIKRMNKFLKTTFINPEVLKRAQIKDIGYHLRSKEMSNEMKEMILMSRPEYIKENLEQMKVIEVLHDSEANDISPDEKSIKEIHTIILELFGGLAEVENLLQDYEARKFKHKCLQTSSNWSDEEEDSEEELKFKKKLDTIFEGLGDGKRHDNFEWVQQRLKQTSYYKDLMKTKNEAETPATTNMQESMVYDACHTFADRDDETSLNNLDEDYSITESKYCSQWLEFNKPDLAYKSTPVQRPANHKSFKREAQLKKTSSLDTKLAETIEEHSEEEPEDEVILKAADEAEKHHTDISTESKQIQSILEMLGKKLNESSLTDNREDLENSYENKCKILHNNNLTKNNEKSNKKSLSSFDNFPIEDDEDALFQAAAEAEMKFTQNQTNNSQINNSNPKEDPTKTQHIKNNENYQVVNRNLLKEDPHKTPILMPETNAGMVKLITPPSLNSTPDFIDIQTAAKVATFDFNTPPEISLQQELDIDMEAFMEPFPEEQDLIRKTHQNPTLSIAPLRRESLKENLNKDFFTRQSPDLFAEEFIKSPIKPQCTRKPTLASKLSTKLNLQKCHSALNPPASLPNKSPSKPMYLNQNPSQLLQSPSSRLSTDKEKYKKSPSLFDMYFKSTKGKGKLPKTLINKSSCLLNQTDFKNSTNLPASQQNESVLVVRKRNRCAAKRKMFDSDSESAENEDNARGVNVIAIDGEAEKNDRDLEEIAATQGHNESSFLQQRRKRRRFNSFIEHEAGVSESENSEDEAEHTLGRYVYDSIVVPSDDEDPDQASTSHMQAMYLQSLKSPQQRRGAFKIPPPRVYNDHSRIFSQAVLPEETYSQSMLDSFIALEEDSFINDRGNVMEVSMCPLEKAEKILKERRRAKKLGLVYVSPVNAKPKHKNRIHIMDDSSSSDEY